MVYRTVVL